MNEIQDREQYEIAERISERLWRASLAIDGDAMNLCVVVSRPYFSREAVTGGRWNVPIHIEESNSAVDVLIGEIIILMIVTDDGSVRMSVTGTRFVINDVVISALVVLNDATEGALVTGLERGDAVSQRTAARIRAMSEEARAA